MGIAHVESSPLTRSSYHARQAAAATDASSAVEPGVARRVLSRQTGVGPPDAPGRLGGVATVLDSIDDDLAAWIVAQPVFFVATAPTGADGHLNLSPKGYDTLRVLDPNTVAYLDLTGSGVETIAHLRENGRITLMLCAFEGPPKIVRLYGTGDVVLPGDPDWSELVGHFGEHSGARAIIRTRVDRLSSSCGYSVPFMTLSGERPTLDQWATRKSPDELVDYRAAKNAVSIDGLPGLD